MPWLDWFKTHVKATLRSLAAAMVVTRLERDSRYDDLVARLRQGPTLPADEQDPVIYARVVGRLLPILPPWRMGRCLKRSLILLHLWSRCGLTPSFNLGVRKAEPDAVEGHAWLTLKEVDDFSRGGSSTGCAPVVEL